MVIVSDYTDGGNDRSGVDGGTVLLVVIMLVMVLVMVIMVGIMLVMLVVGNDVVIN
jgi:flagellar basal body-associated protein FliL